MLRLLKTGLLALLLTATAPNLYAQWVVKDPFNFAQGIVNSTNQVLETSKTTMEMNNTFQETVKIYKQSKAYYDELRSVKNLIRSARKVQECILMVGDISDIYVNSFQRMMRDENYSLVELSAIGYGYTKLITASAATLQELTDIINPSDLSMTDKDRLDVVDKVHRELRKYRTLTRYYTRKNIGVSMLRAEARNQVDQVLSLYGNANERYW